MAKSANPFAIFRKHQKVLLAVAGVGLMLVFVIGDPLLKWFGGGSDRNRVVVRWDGREIRESKLRGLVSERRTLVDFFEQCQRTAILKDRTVRLPAAILSSREEVTLESTAQVHLLADKARKLDVVITDDLIESYLKQVTANKLSTADYKNALDKLRLSKGRLFDILRTEMLADTVEKLFFSGMQSSTPGEHLHYFSRVTRQVKAEIITIRADEQRFLEQVKEPTAAELKKYFEKYKELLPATEQRNGTELLSPTPGFKRPQRVNVAYLRADLQDFADAVEIPDKKFEEYYEKNKDREFRVTEPPIIEKEETHG